MTANQSPNNNNQMKVTVTEPLSLIFGQIFGLGSRTLSRSATAEFNQPLEMGAPDYVLGYAGYPTKLAGASGGTQNFYLIARGPYGQQENGDAYSQYYEGYSGQVFKPTGGNSYDNNPCTPPSGTTPVLPGVCDNLQINPDVNQRLGLGPTAAFPGYDYVVDNPTNQTLIIKIFDPYDESLWSQSPSPHKPTQTIDQWGSCSGGVNFCPAYPTGDPTVSANQGVPVALHFSISGPYLSPYDTSEKPVQTSPTYSSATSVVGTCTSDCALGATSSEFVAGNDPTDDFCRIKSNTPGTNTPSPRQQCYQNKISPYAYQFLNYAIITQKGLYHIHVRSGLNTFGVANTMYGTGGNVFGLAACGVNPGDGIPGHQAVLGRVGMESSDPFAPAAGGAAASAPPTSVGNNTSTDWNMSNSSCLNPNASNPNCTDPSTAPPDNCVHIYANHRMAIINELNVGLSGGQSLIPLGYVPPEYDGKTLQINLYDIGDMSNDAKFQVLTPAGDASTAHPNGGSNSGYPTNLPYTYSAAPTSLDSGYSSGPTNFPGTAASQIVATDSSGYHPYNGKWINMQIPMTNWPAGKTYAGMATQFGGYWKVLYTVGGSGQDTTTWEISISGAPVHLVTGQ